MATCCQVVVRCAVAAAYQETRARVVASAHAIAQAAGEVRSLDAVAVLVSWAVALLALLEDMESQDKDPRVSLETEAVWGVLYRAANTVMWRVVHELEEPAHLNLRGFSATGADVAYLRQHAIGLLEASS